MLHCTVSAAEIEGGEDDGSKHKHGHDGRLVAKSQTIDDVRGRTGLARHGNLPSDTGKDVNKYH